MRDETLVRYEIGERPSEAPEGWTVWNAPRPLYGEIVWHGDFVKGCFYAATNPDAAEYMDVRGQEIRNRDLDACQIEWVTRDKAAQMARERYETDDYYAPLLKIYERERGEFRARQLLIQSFKDHIARPEDRI